MYRDTKYEELSDFFVNAFQLGWLDVQRAMQIWRDTNISPIYLAEWAREYYTSFDYNPFANTMDIVTVTMEYILYEVRTELYALFPNHALIDRYMDRMWVYSNYLDSHFQDGDKLYNYLSRRKQTCWSPCLKWFVSELEQ